MIEEHFSSGREIHVWIEGGIMYTTARLHAREATKRAVNYWIRSNVNFLKPPANVINELKIQTVEIGIIGIGLRVGTNFAVIARAT